MLKFYAQLLLCGLFVFTSLAISAQTTSQNTPTNHKTPAKELLQDYLQNESPLKVSASDIELEVSEDNLSEKAKTRTVRAWQKYNGIYIERGLLSLHYDKEGKVYAVDELIDPPLSATTPAFDATEAVRRTMNYYRMPSALNLEIKEEKFTPDAHIIFDRGMISASDIEARLIYVINPHNGELTLSWVTQMHTPDRQHYYMTYLDATNGKVIYREDKVLHCEFGGGLEYDASPEEQAAIDAKHHAMHMEAAHNWDAMMEAREAHLENWKPTTTVMAPHTYRVLPEPAEAPNDLLAFDGMPAHVTNSLGVDELEQQDITTSGDLEASPRGWHDIQEAGAPATELNYTEGNNVWSFYDPSPSPLGGAPNQATSTLADTDGNYLVDWDLTQEPEYLDLTGDVNHPNPNRSAANINLFYWNNLIHDVFHYFDFTEAKRNFQHVNYTPDGIDNDHVLAQAQDGGGTNNANFLTLTDGVNGQMQMYLWTAALDDKMVKITSGLAGGSASFVAIEGAIYNATSPNPDARVAGPDETVADAPIVLINDGCTGGPGNSTGTTACGTGVQGGGLPPCNDVIDKIVLIDRGDCSFVEKVHGAQLGQAAGVIVMNNDQTNPESVIAMGGTDATINTIEIPSVMVSFNTGQLLKSAIAGGASLTGRLQRDFAAQPKKDGDFDSGIISHEYGHGITIRLSPQTVLGGSLSGDEQGGEGWADFIGLYMTMTQSDLITTGVDLTEHPNGVLPDRGIGSYIRYTDYSGPGIRPRRYSIDESVNEYTFAGTSNGGKGIANAPEVVPPHGVGFVWCTMLYEMTQKLVDLYGISTNPNRLYDAPNEMSDIVGFGGTSDGMNVAMRLILRGIEVQAQSPTFLEMRDGIMQADAELFGGAHTCDLWAAFAKRGLGVDAVDPDNSLGNEVDGYAVPAECLPPGTQQIFYSITKTAEAVADNQENLVYNITVTNTSQTGDEATNVVVTDDLPPFTTFVSATGGDMITNTASSVTWTINSLPAGTTADLTVTVNLQTPTTTTVLDNFEFEGDDGGWTASGGGTNFWDLESGPDAHAGTGYFFCENNNNNDPNAFLMSPTLPAGTDRQLRFWHKYDTDSGFDGGFIEASSDGGLNWAKISMQERPYTGSLNGTFNPLDAGAAYTGSSDYIESAGVLADDVTNIRFVLSEDVGGGSGVGWWIDDVKIVQNPVRVINEISITDEGDNPRTKTATAATLIFGDPAPLSVNLVNLKATALKETIQLDWATASETDNKGFHIERKAPGEMTFTKIAFVNGQGTTNRETDYMFEDKNVITNQTYSYRLLQEDLNGKTSHSNIVTAKIVGQDINMDIVPNPAQDFAYVNITNATENSMVRVLSVDGKVLRSYAIDAAERQTLPLNLQDLPAGMYMVQLQTAEGLLVQKLILE